MNTVEFFIHVEDLRRGQANWEPRAISPALADALWTRVGPGGMAKKVPATVVLNAPGRDDKQSGTGPVVTVTGDPGEHTMFGAGRQQAARVEISGDATLAAQLRAASLGV
jgi:uncharacterized protein (TIGR03085 family)